MILGSICFFAGLAFGWMLFRSERAYLQGLREGERYGRAQGFKIAIRKTSQHPLLNSRTQDWYDK